MNEVCSYNYVGPVEAQTGVGLIAFSIGLNERKAAQSSTLLVVFRHIKEGLAAPPTRTLGELREDS